MYVATVYTLHVCVAARSLARRYHVYMQSVAQVPAPVIFVYSWKSAGCMLRASSNGYVQRKEKWGTGGLGWAVGVLVLALRAVEIFVEIAHEGVVLEEPVASVVAGCLPFSSGLVVGDVFFSSSL